MLTEIEWWGGLLFIWIAICYRIAYKEYMAGGKVSLMFLTFNLAFLSTGIVLALYFYALEGGSGLFYIGALAIAIVSCGLMVFWPASEEDAKEAEEELGKVVSALAGIILFFPLLTSLVLGLVKSIGIFGTL